MAREFIMENDGYLEILGYEDENSFEPSFKYVAETIIFKHYDFIRKFRNKHFIIYNEHMFHELQLCGGPTYDTYRKIMSLSDDLFSDSTDEEKKLFNDYNADIHCLDEILYKFKSEILAKI